MVVNVKRRLIAWFKGEKSLEEISEDFYDKKGYVLDSLAISLISFYSTKSYQDAIIESVNFGGDNDTNGAICGGLAGSYYGYSNIPAKWISRLNKKEFLEEKCQKFYNI